MMRAVLLAILLLAGGCGGGTHESTADGSPQSASVQRAVADTEAAQREAATMRTIGPAAPPAQHADATQTRPAAPTNNTVAEEVKTEEPTE